MLKLAMFDAKPYDRPAFERYAAEQDMDVKFFEAQLTEDTVSLAAGFDAVIPFVNDIVNARVIDALHRGGIRLIAMRCAGYNNVDVRAAHGKLPIVRVPAYSPYAVA